MKFVPRIVPSYTEPLGTLDDPINPCKDIVLNECQIRLLQLPRKFIIDPTEPSDYQALKNDVFSFKEKFRWKYFLGKRN